MPTLQFKGKNIIWNHHLSVPYHTLEEVKKLHYQPEKGEGNLIIEGDNLIALKALLPLYSGKVKCIYIDPPYNTGKEDWIYNDKVNSPLLKEWLGEIVSKDDMTKHDKWLCMIVPRLKLLREFLHETGVIFISLDNNEAFNFKLIADEIFGEENFLGVIVLQTATDNNPTQIATEHEYIFSYCASKSYQDFWTAISKGAELIQSEYLELKKKHKTKLHKIQKELREWIKENKDKLDKVTHYDNVDEKGVFHDGDIANTKFGGYKYEVLHPVTNKACKVPDKGFRFPSETMKKLIEDGDIMFGVDETTLIKPKKRLENVTARLRSIIYEDGRAATIELEHLFKKDFFRNPKSPKVLKKIFEFTTEQDDIILDSFAGSGTTGQAVMELNKQDGESRKFILVQMKEDSESEPNKNICRDKTYKRIKKVIEEYEYNSGFKYLKLGNAIDAETMLEGTLPEYKQFAKYVFYLCTGETKSNDKGIKENEFLVGEFENRVIYLIYKQDLESLTKMALTLDLAEKIIKKNKNKRIIIYAPACFLDQEYLEEKQIEFVGIPYNLFQQNK